MGRSRLDSVSDISYVSGSESIPALIAVSSLLVGIIVPDLSFGIVFQLPSVCFSQADDTARIGAVSVDDTIEPQANVGESYHADFAVLPALVLFCPKSVPFNISGIGQGHTVFGDIGSTFSWVKGDLHMSYCMHNNGISPSLLCIQLTSGMPGALSWWLAGVMARKTVNNGVRSNIPTIKLESPNGEQWVTPMLRVRTHATG